MSFHTLPDESVALNEALADLQTQIDTLTAQCATCKGSAEVTAPAVDSTVVSATDTAIADAPATN